MNLRPLLTALALGTASSVALAQASTPSRADVKAETRAAQKAGALTPAGEGAAPKSGTQTGPSTKTREQRTIALPDLGREVPMPKAYPHNVNHGITLTPDETELWCNGSALNFVAVYTHPGLQHVANIPVGADPNALVFSGDGKFAYVSNRGSDDLSIIDTETYKEIKRLKLGKLPQRMVVIDVAD